MQKRSQPTDFPADTDDDDDDWFAESPGMNWELWNYVNVVCDEIFLCFSCEHYVEQVWRSLQ